MATFYVSSGSGDDSNSGESPAQATKTLGGAMGKGMSDGDTVEILDEETYFEYNITIDIPNLTLTHTASQLGRPKVNALGEDYMWNHQTSGTTFNNIEMFGAANSIVKRGSYPDYGAHGQFHITDCFIHGSKFFYQYLITGNADNKTSFEDSILYFEDAGGVQAGIYLGENAVLKNCLITGAYGATVPIVGDAYADGLDTLTNTASFCTLISRDNITNRPIVQIGKIIDCIVSGTGDGIASDDHTYNLVSVAGASFRNHADSGDAAAGTGDLETANPLFLYDKPLHDNAPTNAIFFQLQTASPARNYGTPYLVTTADLTGNARPTAGGSAGSPNNPDMGCFEYIEWERYKAERYPHFNADFTINTYHNLTPNYRQHPEYPSQAEGLPAWQIPGQVPFFLGPKGPISLRKDKAYLASEGNPSVMTGSG
jgi:hypothetical protein